MNFVTNQTNYKKNKIEHTHARTYTKSMWRFSIKTEMSSNNTQVDEFICPPYIKDVGKKCNCWNFIINLGVLKRV